MTALQKYILALALAGTISGLLACLAYDRLVGQLCTTIPSAMGPLCGDRR